MIVTGVVNSIMSSMTYVLSEEGYDYVWLVDCGDSDKILGIVGRRQIRGVILTHVHYDHIYGLPSILSLYPDCLVFTNQIGKDALASAKLNLSKYHGDEIEISGGFVREVQEGESIELFPGNCGFVYETPGHNPSCLCFKIGEYFFTGDSYIPGIKVVTNLPGGNRSLAESSFKRIESLIQNSKVFAGHALT